MNFEIQFARVTNNGKLPDRFLTCQHTKSSDLAKSSMGDIFTLVEILSPWFPTAQIGQLIINNFAKAYFQGGSTSDLVNFEEALKYVNEGLAQATQNGETDWIGNLNSILAIVIDNNLHISATGKAQAYIFRDGKVNHLTEGLTSGTEIHPLKTFSNIVSGELKSHDKILITNGDLLDQLSLESIRQIITLNNPSTAAGQIVKLLKKARTKKVNFIIVNVFSRDDISNETLAQSSEEVFYLDKATDSIFASIKQIWTNLLSPLGKSAKSTIQKSTKNALNLTKKPVSEEKKLPQSEPIRNDTTNDKFHNEFLNDHNRDDSLLKDEEITYSPDFVHYYKEQKKFKENQFGKYLKILSAAIKFCYEKIGVFFQWILKIYHDKKQRKYLYIALAALLIVIIGFVIIFRNKSAKVGNLESQKILDEALAAESDAKNMLGSNQPDQAKEKFALAIDKALSIQKSPLVSKDAEKVLSESYQELDKLTSTTRFENLTPANTVPDEGKMLFIVAGDAYFITDDTIYKGSLLGGAPTKAATLPKSKGNFIAGSRADKIIYLYTSNQMLFSFTTSTSKLDQLTLSDGKWETANALTSYSGTLYLLDGVLGQIYRHTSSQSSFSPGDEYISSTNINLKETVSLAIDGSVYVLKSDGQVKKILRSKLQDFALKGLPTPYDKIGGAEKIFTDADTPSLYILDNAQKRILEFDKDGVFVHQYALPIEFSKIKDFYVSSKSRKIWVLEGNSVYELSI